MSMKNFVNSIISEHGISFKVIRADATHVEKGAPNNFGGGYGYIITHFFGFVKYKTQFFEYLFCCTSWRGLICSIMTN